ncbi:MAG: polymer-forming cytoskeletal protein [Phycisphaerae bacterium]|nr:polymer-forming cytoskeletal protein [Phycisphaerae bacterium]
MSDFNGEFPTVLGPDAKFKGELVFEKGLRILGQFEGQVRSKGTLHVAEGARVVAQIESANVKVDGEVKGNIVCAEKLTLTSTSRIEGDLRTARLEMNDGAQFVGNVIVGQHAADAIARREPSPVGSVRPVDSGSSPSPRTRPAPAPPEPAPVPIPGIGAGR